MPADNPLAANRDIYRNTANDLTDLIRDLEGFAGRFKSLAQILDDDKIDASPVHAEAQLAYRDLGTLLQLAARLAHPR